jgi:predicted metal-dependent peptidase
MDTRQRERIATAIHVLILEQPFYGVCLLNLELVESVAFDTAATDGKRLFYNPAYIAGLSDRKLRGLLAHEVCHCILAHFARMAGRDLELWNVATDHAINLDLLAAGFELPDGALADPKWRNTAAESVYAALFREREKGNKPGQGKPGNGAPGSGSPQNGTGAPGSNGKPGTGNPASGHGKPGTGAPGGGGADPGKCGGVIAPAEATAAAEAAAKWQEIARQAAAIAGKRAGHVPGEIKRMLEEISNPPRDWQEALARFISESTQKDYSWSRPNRRFVSRGMILPSMRSNGRGRIVFAIDVSGSIDGAAYSAFQAAAQDAMDSGAADACTVIYCDTRIRAESEFQAGERLAFETVGGGGTKFFPVMDWLKENGHDAACCVFFTDLDCDESDFGSDPGIPVLWVNWARPRGAPFGDVIQLDPHQ